VENITKWGSDRVVVTQNDPSHFKALPNFFDLLVVDAPCSGSGLFRKDPDAISEWSEESVLHCSTRQERILEDSIDSLKEGGYLIYSTCSYSFEENEKIMDFISAIPGMHNVEITIPENWNIVLTESPNAKAKGFRFYPDKIKGEGFFICALRKRNSEKTKPVLNKSKSKQEQPNKTQLNILNKWVSSSIPLSYFFWEENIIAMTELVLNEISFLQKNLYLKKAGIQIGSFAKNDLITSHELALSTIINPSLPSIEVDLKTALDYLRLSNLDLPECPVGWTLVKYNQVPLGWIKKLPNRINNYYPKEWKILNK
jgi:NOL1/NOP2/fmu family ribosome biogenesis protein